MSLSNTTVFECRTTGNDNNGGGFNAAGGSPGTDRSQQDAAQVFIDGATITATVHTTTTQITVVGYTVVAADNRNLIQITGGTATAGFYEITAVDTVNNRWTLDRSAGTAAQTVIGRMGGAVATPGKLSDATALGQNLTAFGLYIKAGTYTFTTGTAGAGGPLALGTFAIGRIEGYQTTRGDLGTAPVLHAGSVTGMSGGMVSGATSRGVSVVNVEANGNSGANNDGFQVAGTLYLCTARNCVVGWDSGFAVRCQAISCGTGFGGTASTSLGCTALSCTTGFGALVRASHCIARSCTNGFLGGSGSTAVCDHCVAHNCTKGFDLSAGGSFAHLTCRNCVATQCSTFGFDNSGNRVLLVGCAGYQNTSGNSDTSTGNVDSYGFINLTADPWADAANGDFRPNNTVGGGLLLRAAGLGVIGQTDMPDIGAIHHADPSQPAVGQVRVGVVYNDGGSTGTHTDPATTDVLLGVQWGADGIEFTGSFSGGGGPTDYPAPADVRAGVGYNFGALVGTLTPTIVPPPSVLALSENAERVREAVRAKLDAALPDRWNVYARRDLVENPADQWPRCTVVLLPELLLEVETDNRVLVGYPCAVTLEVKEAAVRRTDPPLSAHRRTCQQAVYTTDYPGLSVEWVDVAESAGIPLPDVEDGVTATAFLVTLAVLEERAAGEAAG